MGLMRSAAAFTLSTAPNCSGSINKEEEEEEEEGEEVEEGGGSESIGGHTVAVM